MTTIQYFLLFSFISNNLTNYGRRHLTHSYKVSCFWDTLYVNTYFESVSRLPIPQFHGYKVCTLYKSVGLFSKILDRSKIFFPTKL